MTWLRSRTGANGLHGRPGLSRGTLDCSPGAELPRRPDSGVPADVHLRTGPVGPAVPELPSEVRQRHPGQTHDLVGHTARGGLGPVQ